MSTVVKVVLGAAAAAALGGVAYYAYNKGYEEGMSSHAFPGLSPEEIEEIENLDFEALEQVTN